MYKKILVPVDGSHTASKGLAEAIRLARALGATLKLVHVVNDVLPSPVFDAPSYSEQLVAELRERGRTVLAAGRAAAAAQAVAVEDELLDVGIGTAAGPIVETAQKWGAELIVMGTHGRRGLRRLALGSDAELVLRRSPVPVLLVRDSPEI